MRSKLTVIILALLLVALPVSAQDSTGEPTAEPTEVVTAAPTEVATAEATTAATVEATTAVTTEATAESTMAATSEATTEATVEATVEATAVPTVEATPQPDSPDGVHVITGTYVYSDASLPTYNSETGVVLLDISGAATQTIDPIHGFTDFGVPQFLGKLTLDEANSRYTYELRLPDDPGGALKDVNHDGKTDTGVMIYDVNMMFNVVGDGFLQVNDVVWVASDLGYDTYKNYGQLRAGKIVIYAPDDQQSISSGFGADGLLFTDDDPVAPVEKGWTVVNLDTTPFTFEHGATATADLMEAPLQAIPNFSDQSYSQAFDSLVKVMRQQYSYGDYYHIDWDALSAKYRPQFEKAEQDKDVLAYEQAVQAFIREFTDIHVGVDAAPLLFSQPNPLTDDIKGGIGMTIRELDDGRVIVNYIVADGPADQAGIEVKAEILKLNGRSGTDIVEGATALNPPDLDNNHDDVIKRDKERGAIRFPIGAEVDVTFKNPGASQEQTVTLTATDEDESRLVSRTALYGDSPNTDVPVEYRILDNGYGYVKINSFFDDGVLTNNLWRRAMSLFENAGVTGIVIDLRDNGGGWDFNGSNMLGFLYDEQQSVGESADFFTDINRFELNPLAKEIILPADDESARYHGKIAIMVSPFCVSECEFFSWAVQHTGRGKIIGQYHTAGGGGSIQNVYLPEDVEIQFTASRGLDPDGNVKIQGTGVVPDIKVPVTEDTVFAEDPVQDAAIEYLDEATTIQAVNGGNIAVGDSKSGTLEPFSAANYTFIATEDATLDISLTDPDKTLDTVLKVYDENGAELAENDNAEDGSPNSEIKELDVKAGDTITIEASTYDPTVGGDYTLTVKAA